MSKTGWFTVWANGKQKLGLISFVPNRVYHLHKSVPFNEIGRKSLKLVWPWRNGTRITVWNIPSGKTVRLFLVFRCSLKVFAGKTPKRCVSFTFQKHFVNGKQPQKALSLTTIRYKKDVEDSEEGLLPYKRQMGMCRWMGSHFHDWIDYNGVAFSIQLLKWGRTFSDFWG